MANTIASLFQSCILPSRPAIVSILIMASATVSLVQYWLVQIPVYFNLDNAIFFFVFISFSFSIYLADLG